MSVFKIPRLDIAIAVSPRGKPIHKLIKRLSTVSRKLLVLLLTTVVSIKFSNVAKISSAYEKITIMFVLASRRENDHHWSLI